MSGSESARVWPPPTRSRACARTFHCSALPRLAIGLNLLGLRLPGDTGPHDLSLSVHDLADLEATVLQLVLTVVKAGVAAAGSGPLAALAGLLGLRDGSS